MSFKLINMTGRLEDFYIDVSNSSDGASAEQCARDGVPYKSAETRIYSCPSNIYGQFIRIRFRHNVTGSLQLCEVQVQGGKWSTLELELSNVHFAQKLSIYKS